MSEANRILADLCLAVEADRPDVAGKDEEWVYDELRMLGVVYLRAKAYLAGLNQSP